MSKGSRRRPADPLHVQPCTAVGHTAPDAKGRCLRCGELVTPKETPNER